MISYRFAKLSDSSSIAKLHLSCARSQKGGFFHKLGYLFLNQYYRIELSNTWSVVLLAEDDFGQCVGFHSGTLRAEEHFVNLKNNRIKLALSVLPQCFVNPKILLDLFTRYKFVSNPKSDKKFGVSEGPRGEYWGWSSKHPNPVESLNLHKKWHLIMKTLGVTHVRSEVDIVNDRIFRSIKIMGGIILQEITLHDGRKRAIVEYDLSNYKFNL